MKSDNKNGRNIEARLYSLLRLPPLGAEGVDSERVLDRLRDAATSQHTSHRYVDAPIHAWRTPWRVAVICAAVAAALVIAVSPAIWKTPDVIPANHSTTKTLADGSRIELRADAEAVVENAPDGLIVRLNSGSMMVFAAKQAAGRHLYVQTRDLKVSVVGTVFLVNADDKGSRVAVMEGEVRVQQGTVEKSLQPGEQLASNPKSENLQVFQQTGWSREAYAYLSKLHESMAQSLAARRSPGRTASVSDKPKFEEASIRLCAREIPGAALQGGRGGPVGGSGSIRITPGRVDALCVTAATLIRAAHRPLNNNPAPVLERIGGFGMNRTTSVEPEDGTRVRGGPDWVRSDKYTIAAVGDSTDAPTLRGPMLLDLLERRFNLKLRVETEEFPVYALTIAKGGLKIKPIEIESAKYEELRKIRASLDTSNPQYADGRLGDGTLRKIRASLDTSNPANPANPANGVDPKDLATYSGLLGCSLLSQAVRNDRVELSRFREAVRRGLQPPECFGSDDSNGPNWVRPAAGAAISSLVNRLNFITPDLLPDTLNGLWVVDKTGLPDTNCLIAIPPAGTPCAPVFNYVLEFAMDERPGRPDMNLPKAPNIFDALEKLGLHLEKVKTPREFIVIEQIERPSEN